MVPEIQNPRSIRDSRWELRNSRFELQDSRFSRGPCDHYQVRSQICLFTHTHAHTHTHIYIYIHAIIRILFPQFYTCVLRMTAYDCRKPSQGGWGASPWKPCVASASHTIKPKPFSFQTTAATGVTWRHMMLVKSCEAQSRKPIEQMSCMSTRWIRATRSIQAGVLVKVLDLPGKDSKFLSNRCKQTMWTYVHVAYVAYVA